MSGSEAYQNNLKTWSDIQDHLPLLRESSHGDVMEIGVRGGFSTSALLAGIEEKGGHLYSVDINNCQVFKGHPQWSFLCADSIREVERVQRFIPKELHLLFVDGDHTYEGCLSDLTNYAPLAKTVLIHDCLCPLTFPGVRKACEEYAKREGRPFAIVDGSYGMGIMQ